MLVLPPLVIKIGGSVLATGGAHEESGAARETSSAAHGVLDLVMRSKRSVIIVPGGGIYADAVRAEQRREAYDDRTAHRLATLAMHRTAADLQTLAPELVPVAAVEEAKRALTASKKCIWLPWPMIENQPGIVEDWSMTSDALAAWLAGKIGAADVVLIKSCDVPSGQTLDDLTRAGIIDAQFPQVVARSQLRWHVLSAHNTLLLASILDESSA